MKTFPELLEEANAEIKSVSPEELKQQLDNEEIIEFCDPRIQSIKNTLEEMFDVKIKNHSLYFFGEKNKK